MAINNILLNQPGGAFSTGPFSVDPNLSPNNANFAAAVRAVFARPGLSLQGLVTILAAAGGGKTLQVNGYTNITSSIGVGLQLDSTSANGVYETFLRSGAALADMGNSAQVFGGGTLDNLGIGTRGAQGLDLGTNGLVRFNINSSGDVTINAPSSGATLTVNGASGASPMMSVAAVGTNNRILDITDGTSVFDFITDSSHNFSIGSTTAHSVSIQTGGFNNRLTIDSSGAASIAMPSSSAPTLVGTGTQSNSVFVAKTAGGGGAGFSVQTGNGTAASIQLSQSSQGNWVMYNPNSVTDVRLYDGTKDVFKILTGGGVSSYGATAAGLVDMTPDSGTFTGTYQGFTAAITGVAYWSRQGNNVTLLLPYGTGSSNNANTGFAPLPVEIQSPVRRQICRISVVNNGAQVTGWAIVEVASGTLTIDQGEGAAGFTASGAKAIGFGSTIWQPITYSLA